jgi:molybdopterin converting factor small subunit
LADFYFIPALANLVFWFKSGEMKVKVLFWGSLTELVKDNEWEMEGISSVSQLKNRLFELVPGLSGSSFFVAVNQEVTRSDLALHDGDEVALMPPYSGG